MNKIFELILEIVGWIRIVASPLIVGLGLGVFLYLSNPSTTWLIIGITITALGLLIGIIWATKIRKTKGTMWYLSRIIATPDIDEDNNEITKAEE